MGSDSGSGSGLGSVTLAFMMEYAPTRVWLSLNE